MMVELLCAGGFVLICLLLAVAGVAVWFRCLQGGAIGITSGGSELALRDRAEAARTNAKSKQEQKRDQVISAAQKKTARAFRRTMGAEPDRVEICFDDTYLHGERILWYDGMELWFRPASMFLRGAGEDVDCVKVPPMWFLKGLCPKCGKQCWSMPIYNLAGLGAMLKTFVPLSAKEGKRLWTDCPYEIPHRCSGIEEDSEKRVVHGD